MTFITRLSEPLRRRIDPDLVFCQVFIQKTASGFELRHVSDRHEEIAALKGLRISNLRGLAQSTAGGAFRPLRSAPNLARGWLAQARSIEEVVEAIDHLYPGGLADWLAVESGRPPVTDYRDFTARQTGMYRITALLDDSQAADMTRVCCDARFCLKRRFWTVGGLTADAPETKSILPCLEPCAILLEFARKITRLEQDEGAVAAVAACDPHRLRTQLDELTEKGLRCDQREADFNDPGNPRILLWKLLKRGERSLLSNHNSASP